MEVRAFPWLLALIGLAIPIFATDLAALPVVALWVIVLGFIWTMKPLARARRDQRIAVAVASMLVLVFTASLFGLFLIPAAATWLLIEVVMPNAAYPESDPKGS